MPGPAAPTALSAGSVASLTGVREALQWCTREKQWISDIHLQLCRIPAPTFLEQQRAEWMQAQFRALGWHASIDRAGNVLASLEPDPEGPLLAITAHLDTVLAPRTKDDVLIDNDGDLRGPGVSDNGAGLAALLAIAKAVRSLPATAEAFDAVETIWRKLLLVANVGEEGEGNLRGIRHLCETPELVAKIGNFLVLDGASTDHITVHALGSRRFEISFAGAGGHSWSDFGTGNPVHALSRAIASFVDHNPADPRSLPRLSINVGVIEGGAGVNAIPGSARAKVDLRSEDNESLNALVASLHTAVVRAEDFENARATGAKITAKIREIGSRPAARLASDSPLISAIRSVDGHLGIRARLDCASTDANIPLSLGIPAISIGAGGLGGGAHTPGEWYRPNGRDLGLKRVLLTAALLLQQA